MSTSKVLIPRLNEVIKEQVARLGIQYRAADFAPGTYADLRADGCNPTLVVWAGASHNTIYGDPAVNHAFRAWHDWTHIRYSLPFTLAGEVQAAQIQAGLVGGTLAEVVLAEVAGNAEHFAQYGVFPVDPVEFVSNWLRVKV